MINMISKEQRRIQILEAAVKVFSEKGISKTKIEDIAKQAEIGKGTIYEYFDSKEDLFLEMVKYSVRNYHERLKGNLLKGNNIKEKITNFLRYHVTFLCENMDLLHMAVESNTVSKEMRYWMMKEREVIFSLLEQVLSEAKRRGEVKEDLNTELAVFSIIGAANQYGTNRLFHGKRGYDDSDLEAIIDIIFKGVGR